MTTAFLDLIVVLFCVANARHVRTVALARVAWWSLGAYFAVGTVEAAPFATLLIAGFLAGYLPGYLATRPRRRRSRW